MTHPFRPMAAVLALAAALASCAAPAGPVPQADRPGCLTDFDPATDYFPVKADLAYAENVEITYERSYQVVTVNQPFPGGAPESTVLLRCGAPAPELPAELADAPVIETPVRSLYSGSTTQLQMIVEVGALDVLTGVAAPEFVSGTEVRERIDDGSVTGFAESGQVETEAVLGADPDVLLSEGTDNPAFPALRAAGIPVIGWADYLEVGPLGQAEWIKVVGALTGREADAARVFGEIEQRYTDTVATAAGIEPTPAVVGELFQGSWSVPTGASTSGTLIRDAGGTWSQAGNPGPGTVASDFETVFTADGDASIWLANGPYATRDDALAADPRYGELAAVRDGQIWTPDLRIGATGGNDAYERGVARPDEVLADLVAVLHPELLPDHEFVYYQQVPG